MIAGDTDFIGALIVAGAGGTVGFFATGDAIDAALPDSDAFEGLAGLAGFGRTITFPKVAPTVFGDFDKSDRVGTT
jgi:hypothetical protein